MEEEQELEQELEQEGGEEVSSSSSSFSRRERASGFRDEEEVEADLEPASDTNDYTSSSDYSDDSYSSSRKPVGLPDFNNMMSNVQSGMYNVQMFAFLVAVFAILLLGAYAKFKYERWMRGPAPRVGGGSRSAFSSQTSTPNKGPPIEWSEDWSDDDDLDDDFGPVHKIV